MRDVTDDDKQHLLRAHLEERYGVRVGGLKRLDRGVFAISLQDGRRWIARIFPEKRPVEQVVADAAVLRFLEQHDFPAERCADTAPVTILYGRGILVTEYVAGATPDSSERTLRAYGDMLGRLTTLPAENGAVMRPAGALHHYAQGAGSPRNELTAAASWLTAIEDRVPSQSRPAYDSIRERIAQADDCHDLPESLIHPDPVLKNLLATPGGDLVMIDWTGAGRGPRIASLAVLIWSSALQKGSWSPRRVAAVVAGIQTYTQLEEGELERLAGVMRNRPLVFACWRYRHAILAGHVPDGTEWWWPDDALVQAIASHACAEFQK